MCLPSGEYRGSWSTRVEEMTRDGGFIAGWVPFNSRRQMSTRCHLAVGKAALAGKSPVP